MDDNVDEHLCEVNIKIYIYNGFYSNEIYDLI